MKGNGLETMRSILSHVVDGNALPLTFKEFIQKRNIMAADAVNAEKSALMTSTSPAGENTWSIHPDLNWKLIYKGDPGPKYVKIIKNQVMKEVYREGGKSEKQLVSEEVPINLSYLSDKVYSIIEDRLRIERERRGLYG